MMITAFVTIIIVIVNDLLALQGGNLGQCSGLRLGKRFCPCELTFAKSIGAKISKVNCWPIKILYLVFLLLAQLPSQLRDWLTQSMFFS